VLLTPSRSSRLRRSGWCVPHGRDGTPRRPSVLTLARARPLPPLARRQPQAFAPPPTPTRADAMPRRGPRQPASQAGSPAAPVLPCPRPLQACRHAICAARVGFTMPQVQLSAEPAEEQRAECLEAAQLLRRLATAACAAGRAATRSRRRDKRASSADSSTRPASVALPEAEPVRRRRRLWVDA